MKKFESQSNSDELDSDYEDFNSRLQPSSGDEKVKHSLSNEAENDMIKDDEFSENEAYNVEIESETQFTPFNMKEEYKKGELDTLSHYNKKQKPDEYSDDWIPDGSHESTEKVFKYVVSL